MRSVRAAKVAVVLTGRAAAVQAGDRFRFLFALRDLLASHYFFFLPRGATLDLHVEAYCDTERLTATGGSAAAAASWLRMKLAFDTNTFPVTDDPHRFWSSHGERPPDRPDVDRRTQPRTENSGG